mmetsp:Transcript_9182/g.11465  ORF Transcript_9182/g.11465 Transcript_9182/m.11465 type:complete len:95 (+) Transcript_9182:38-322(+)
MFQYEWLKPMIDYTIIQYLNQHSKTGKFRKRDVVARYPTKYLNKRRVLEPGPGVIDDIFNQYDFIGLVELAGESLAVLINVLGIGNQGCCFWCN